MSPAGKPRYYIQLIRQLHSLFLSDIHGNGDVPLVINTCGWTKGHFQTKHFEILCELSNTTDLGVALLIDVIRLTSPTHIVRMVPERPRVFDPITDFLPLTPHTLTSGTGVVTSSTPVVPSSVEELWYSENIVGLRGEVR